ncbi:MAG TPA: H-NS histone family protein [Chlorobaculum sp.]|nr:H-NS histone family protein [Chlorobaculum sp.]
MKTITELQAEIAAIQKQIEARKSVERKSVIKEIKAKMAQYDITPDDLQLIQTVKKEKTKKAKPVIKYRKSANETWGGGKGPKPKWIKEILATGGDISIYLVKKSGKTAHEEAAVQEAQNNIPLFD